MPYIKLECSCEIDKDNSNEKMRRIYSFSIGEQMADMMAVIMDDDMSLAFNMDGDRYTNGNNIPSEILDILRDRSTEEIEKEFFDAVD